MVLFDWGKQAKVFGRGVEESGVLLRFVHLSLEFCFGPLITIGAGLGCKLRVNGGVLIGLALNREVEALLEDGVLLIVAELGGIADD
jgi:hypothetical protein